MDTGPATLESIEGMVRFNAWMYENIAPSIGSHVLEVGAGIGNITQFLVDRELVVASDIEEHHLAVLKKKFGHMKNVRIIPVNFMADTSRQLEEYRFDTVVCLNVLEHIKDDRMALLNMYRSLAPGGKLVLLVPAFMWLYGSLDEHLQHFRRYHKQELVDKIAEAGFTIRSVRWMNMAGIPGWFLNARIRKVRSLPPAQLMLYDKLVPIFRLVEKITGPPIGQSLIVIGQK